MPDRLSPANYRPPPSTCPACGARGRNPLEPYRDPQAPDGDPAGDRFWVVCAACGHGWDAGGPPVSHRVSEGFGVAPPMVSEEEET